MRHSLDVTVCPANDDAATCVLLETRERGTPATWCYAIRQGRGRGGRLLATVAHVDAATAFAAAARWCAAQGWRPVAVVPGAQARPPSLAERFLARAATADADRARRTLARVRGRARAA
ncbi:MAG TPA: hypothetical protein VHH11_13875 [Gammaproteobacteria bacterium]|nr:hypothetical protein [Gammaproteobacteria bacterium]